MSSDQSAFVDLQKQRLHGQEPDLAFSPKPSCRPDDVAHVRQNHRLPVKAASSNGVIIVRDNAERCTFPSASSSLSTTPPPTPSTRLLPLLPGNTVSGPTLPSAAHSVHYSRLKAARRGYPVGSISPTVKQSESWREDKRRLVRKCWCVVWAVEDMVGLIGIEEDIYISQLTACGPTA